jgi:RNA polymerase sigma-70 factor (ECF subfamily)
MASDAPDTPPPALTPQRGTSLTLLQRLRDNEPQAWRTMVQLYTPLIVHWCARRGVRGADAEDVVQEVLKAAAAGLSNFRREKASDSFRGWLHGIMRNMLLAHHRRHIRQPQASGGTNAFVQLKEVPDAAAPADEEDDPPSELEALQRRALELVRDQVEERTWQAFWFTAIEGHSPNDIAASLGITPTAVRVAKSRVLHRLKEQFGDLIQ